MLSPSAYAAISPYSMPLCTILTKWPAPDGPQCSQPRSAVVGSPSRPGCGRWPPRRRVRARRRSAPSGRPRRRRRRPSGSSRARGRTRRRWCRRRGSGCRARCSGPARSTSSRYHELPPSMSVSPGDSSGASLAIVSSTNAAGTIIQMWRGAVERVDQLLRACARRGRPRPRASRTGAAVDVVDDAVVAGAVQPADHVGAHRPRPIMPSWTEAGSGPGDGGFGGGEGGTVGHAHRLPRRVRRYGATLGDELPRTCS